MVGNASADNASPTKRARGRPHGATEKLTRQIRLVHRGHFAFARAVIGGLDPGDSYRRYLRSESEGAQARTASTTIKWLRSEFVAAARKQAKPGTARLLEIDVSKIPAPKVSLPSIDNWAAANGWEGFPESEVLHAYETAMAEQGGEAEQLAKRTRLVEKQLDALHWLEGRVAQAPQAGDACRSWFTKIVGDQLADAEVMTLAQLAERINGLGKHWYRSIAGIGPIKARRIEDWLREHAEDTGLILGSHVRVSRSRLYPEELDRMVKPATAVRPLEKFVVPADLDGSQGAYRQPQKQCLLRARNDYAAIAAWLNAKRSASATATDPTARSTDAYPMLESGAFNQPKLSHTQRAYRKEAERFLLWAILERRKPLSSMTTEDCTAYRDFLANPQPADTWCGPRARQRWSPLWRPFEGPLSPAGRRHAVTILKNLYTFLTQQNYLMGNPWSGVAMPRDPGRQMASRSFTHAQWDFICKQLRKLGAEKKPHEQSEKVMRLAFTMNFLYATGLRLSEAVNARVSDLNWVEYPPGPGREVPTVGWELSVIGKGEKLREVVVPDGLVEHLKVYLAKRGLGADLNGSATQAAYLLAPLQARADQAERFTEPNTELDLSAGIAEATLYSILKEFFTRCADKLARSDSKGAGQLRKASTHWLRHTYASHGIARGVPLEITQSNLGHSSIATTTLYVTTEKERRMRAMQEAWNVT